MSATLLSSITNTPLPFSALKLSHPTNEGAWNVHTIDQPPPHKLTPLHKHRAREEHTLTCSCIHTLCTVYDHTDACEHLQLWKLKWKNYKISTKCYHRTATIYNVLIKFKWQKEKKNSLADLIFLFPFSFPFFLLALSYIRYKWHNQLQGK